MTQKQRILEYMRKHDEITQRDAIWLGCYRLAAQIFDLKREGNDIQREMRTVTNKDGSHSRIAAYRLVEEAKDDDRND